MLIDLFLQFKKMISIRSDQNEDAIIFKNPDDLFFGNWCKDRQNDISTTVLQRCVKDRTEQIGRRLIGFGGDLQTCLGKIDADLVSGFEIGSVIAFAAGQV